jgi:hypothetical protein
MGPLTFEEGGPINRMSLTPTMESADVGPVGTVGSDFYLCLSTRYENDSAATHMINVDMERLIRAATVRGGDREGLEVGGRVPLATRSAGVLDRPVRWYHESLGLGQANRQLFPEEGHRYVLGDGAGEAYIDVAPQSLGLEDVRLFAKWRALQSADRRSVLSLKAVTRIPTSENTAGQERTDFGVMALGRASLGAWYVHGMLGASTVRGAAHTASVLRERSTFFSLAAERSLGSSVAVVVQYHFSTPALQGFDNRELDWPLSNFVFGLAGRVGERWKWNASFQEDIPADAPAIDFTVGLGLSYLWG